MGIHETNTLYAIIFICFSLLMTGCSFFIKESEIVPTIDSDNLIFNFPNKDFYIIQYEINSLEEYRSDGLTFRTVLKEEIQHDIEKIVITKYKNKNILDNHAYYLLIVKTGAVFQTLGFCINNHSIYLNENNRNNEEFINKCHNFMSK